MRYDEASAQNAAPCGLLYDAVVQRPVKKGDLITYDNVAVNTGNTIYDLRRRQDAMWSTREADNE